MINFPCAKINLGLNIVSRRNDGYHNLQTVFMPIPLTDALEITPMDEHFPSHTDCDLKLSGNALECHDDNNLIIKAYRLLAKDYKLPRLHAHLYKYIPSEAGLGGGSSDATHMLRLLNEGFNLNIPHDKLSHYATILGADCPFFINATPAYAEGIGELLTPINIYANGLKGYHIIIVKPQVSVSTKEAFSLVTPHMPKVCCRDVVTKPIEQWRELLSNDFEQSVFSLHPQLAQMKQKLYEIGALYAQMSGSGSSLYGIFKEKIECLEGLFNDCKTYVMKL